jgi:hypothetical protein
MNASINTRSQWNIDLPDENRPLTWNSRATAQVFTLARQERDAWVQWPARVAADLAAELGLETHAVQTARGGGQGAARRAEATLRLIIDPDGGTADAPLARDVGDRHAA